MRKKHRTHRRRRNAVRTTEHPGLQIELLEQRELLDASGVLSENLSTGSADVDKLEATKQSLAFVDRSIEGHQLLTAGLDAFTEIFYLDADIDGVDKIASIIATRSEIDAIHIVSHGSVGQLQLGRALLTTESMNGRHANSLSTIRSALNTDADILIYGCNFGQGSQGREAASLLSELTGADVAASEDITGNVLQGGDWELEFTTGDIQSSLFFPAEVQMAFPGTLAIASASKTIYAINGDTSLGAGTGTNDFPLVAGDIVTYSIEFELEDSNFTDLLIEDFLPSPVFEVDDPDANDNVDESTPDDGPGWVLDTSAPSSNVPAVGVISIGQNDTFYGSGTTLDANAGRTHYENNVSTAIDFATNRLTLDYGDYTTDVTVATTVHVYFTIRVNDRCLHVRCLAEQHGSYHGSSRP